MGLNTHVINTFRKSFEDDCIELVVNAYNKALSEKKYQVTWHENDFSELLSKYVNDSQLSIIKKITCKTENKLLSQTVNYVTGFADKLPRIDFVYFKIWGKQRFHCFMEAKRLKEKDTGLKKAYINEGMDRYISEKYPIGCMLGYLLEGEVNKTIEGINSLLEIDQRKTETLKHKSNKLLSSCFESTHSSVGIIKHLIFDFTVILN